MNPENIRKTIRRLEIEERNLIERLEKVRIQIKLQYGKWTKAENRETEK